MSWHAGNWGDFVVSLGSAIGTVAAAWFAYKAAKSNSKSQERMDEVKVFDNLLAIALRIDNHTEGLTASDMSTSTKSSIASLICVAHAAIVESGIAATYQERLKEKFILMLPPTIKRAMLNEVPGSTRVTDLAKGSDMLLIMSYNSARIFFSDTNQTAH